jgi:hypothetical protein
MQDFLYAQKGRYRITASHNGISAQAAKAKHAPNTVQPKSNNKTTYAQPPPSLRIRLRYAKHLELSSQCLATQHFPKRLTDSVIGRRNSYAEPSRQMYVSQFE